MSDPEKIVLVTAPPCLECKQKPGHLTLCSRRPSEAVAEEFRRTFPQWQKECQLLARLLSKAREQAMFWQGKFAILKAENNALRRQLYRQGSQVEVWRRVLPAGWTLRRIAVFGQGIHWELRDAAGERMWRDRAPEVTIRQAMECLLAGEEPLE